MERLYWYLDGHTPVATDDVLTWGKMFDDDQKRRVAYTKLPGGVSVSTVFLGIDHRFRGSGPPILFETMVFGTDDDMTERYTTWDEAQAGHDAIVADLKAAAATEQEG